MSKEMTSELRGLGPAVSRFVSLDDDDIAVTLAVGTSTPCFPGVFITLGSARGDALIEVNPGECGAVSVDGADVVDVAQASAGQTIRIGGRPFVILMPMQVFVPDPAERLPKIDRHRKLLGLPAALPLTPGVVALPVRHQGKMTSVRPKRGLSRAARFGALAAALFGGAAVGSTYLRSALPQTEAIVKDEAAVNVANQAPAATVQVAAAQPQVAQGQVSPVLPGQTQARATQARATQAQAAQAQAEQAEAAQAQASQEQAARAQAARALATQATAATAPAADAPVATPLPSVAAPERPKALAPSKAPKAEKVGESSAKRPEVKPAEPDASAFKEKNRRLQELVLLSGFDPDQAMKGLRELAREVPDGTTLGRRIRSEIAKLQP